MTWLQLLHNFVNNQESAEIGCAIRKFHQITFPMKLVAHIQYDTRKSTFQRGVVGCCTNQRPGSD